MTFKLIYKCRCSVCKWNEEYCSIYTCACVRASYWMSSQAFMYGRVCVCVHSFECRQHRSQSMAISFQFSPKVATLGKRKRSQLVQSVKKKFFLVYMSVFNILKKIKNLILLTHVHMYILGSWVRSCEVKLVDKLDFRLNQEQAELSNFRSSAVKSGFKRSQTKDQARLPAREVKQTFQFKLYFTPSLTISN